MVFLARRGFKMYHIKKKKKKHAVLKSSSQKKNQNKSESFSNGIFGHKKYLFYFLRTICERK